MNCRQTLYVCDLLFFCTCPLHNCHLRLSLSRSPFMYLGLINLNVIFTLWFHSCLLTLLYRLGQKEIWKWTIATMQLQSHTKKKADFLFSMRWLKVLKIAKQHATFNKSSNLRSKTKSPKFNCGPCPDFIATKQRELLLVAHQSAAGGVATGLLLGVRLHGFHTAEPIAPSRLVEVMTQQKIPPPILLSGHWLAVLLILSTSLSH